MTATLETQREAIIVADIRRREYVGGSGDTSEVLDAVRFGHLALTDAEGRPVVKPMNYVRVGDRLYFHRARPGEMTGQLGRPACFVATDALAWLPSSWRHAELACPATTYYRSVVVHATAEVVEDHAEKAAALEAFMRKYQPEGGYRPIAADDKLYDGPIKGVLVFRLGLESATCKLKVGQNLDAATRKKMFDHLMARGGPGDARTARAMAGVDPALAGALYPRTEDGLSFVDDADEVPVEQLTALIARTYWASGRTRAVMARALQGSHLVMAAMDGDRLVAFARVVSDGAIHAWVHDVVVDEAYRGRGLGRRLMEHLLAHPRLSPMPSVGLTTVDRMSFYESLGFKRLTAYDAPYGRSTMMRLERSVQHEPVAAGDERVEQRPRAQQLVGGEGAAGRSLGDDALGGEDRGQRGHPLPVGVGDQRGAAAGAGGAPQLRLDGAAGAPEAGREPAGPREKAGHPARAPSGEARHQRSSEAELESDLDGGGSGEEIVLGRVVGAAGGAADRGRQVDRFGLAEAGQSPESGVWSLESGVDRPAGDAQRGGDRGGAFHVPVADPERHAGADRWFAERLCRAENERARDAGQARRSVHGGEVLRLEVRRQSAHERVVAPLLGEVHVVAARGRARLEHVHVLEPVGAGRVHEHRVPFERAGERWGVAEVEREARVIRAKSPRARGRRGAMPARDGDLESALREPARDEAAEGAVAAENDGARQRRRSTSRTPSSPTSCSRYPWRERHRYHS
jgi:nitroimidazol reductase NimA-like FMN-containing flavoprotein (pyridoxamine 5'-phosphate oxidase superfamily)/GNAT superfamily N-acetyltransferase